MNPQIEECTNGVCEKLEGATNTNCTLEELLSKYLNDFTIEDNAVIGYINELETFKEILEKMKMQGFAFSVRDSDVRQKQSKCMAIAHCVYYISIIFPRATSSK